MLPGSAPPGRSGVQVLANAVQPLVQQWLSLAMLICMAVCANIQHRLGKGVLPLLQKPPHLRQVPDRRLPLCTGAGNRWWCPINLRTFCRERPTTAVTVGQP